MDRIGRGWISFPRMNNRSPWGVYWASEISVPHRGFSLTIIIIIMTTSQRDFGHSSLLCKADGWVFNGYFSQLVHCFQATKQTS